MRVDISPDPQHLDYVRIDEADAADTDTSLAKVILPCLEQFRERVLRDAVVAPSDLHDYDYDATQLLLPFLDEAEEIGRSYDRAEARWSAMVDQMIEGFAFLVHPPSPTFQADRWPEYNARRERAIEGIALFGRYFTHLYVY